MRNRAQVGQRHAGYTDAELHAIMASLAEIDSGDVCEVVSVVIFHAAGGRHELRVLTDNERGPERVAEVLRHAADHCHGGCRRCRAGNRKAGHDV